MDENIGKVEKKIRPFRKIFGDGERGGRAGGWSVCGCDLVGDKTRNPLPKHSFPSLPGIIQQGPVVPG